MQLAVNSQPQTFIPLKSFQTNWNLPAEFSLDFFEPKNWEVGSIDGAGEHLARVRQTVLQSVPPHISVATLPDVVTQLAAIFEQSLLQANKHIQLREAEIDFAVAGFSDVLQAIAYGLIQFYYSPTDAKFDIETIQQQWLNESVRVGTTVHPYQHAGQTFQVQVVYNAYGRVGLQVNVDDETHYLADTRLACPAWHYMDDLCYAVAEQLQNNTLAP